MSQRGYQPAATEVERLLEKRIADLVHAVNAQGVFRTTAFLNDREQALAIAVLNRLRHSDCAWQGGYPEAERKMLCIYESVSPENAFSIATLRISIYGSQTLTHRDYLGALMALQIKRECIGDILCDEHGATLFVQQKVAPVILDELTEVSRYRAAAETVQTETTIALENNASLQKATLASLRLDALLAAMLHVSRAQAVQLIQAKAVQINHVQTQSAHSDIFSGDVFSVKGYGKYKLCDIGEKSRKDRTFITYIQY